MPLRDHFRSPVNDRHTWDALYGTWPAMIVQQLNEFLPDDHAAAPCVRCGKYFDADADAPEADEPSVVVAAGDVGGGEFAAAPPRPTLTLEADLYEADEYGVRVYDAGCGRELVAAVEVVSPANKDRAKDRRALVARVAALLGKGVCVSVVDVVTIREDNLYADLLGLLGGTDPQLGPTPPHLYAVTMRTRKRPRERSLLDVWYYPMTLGQPLPTLPIWLTADLRVLLPLEASYEESCRLLHIA